MALMPVDEAQTRLLSGLRPLSVERVAIGEAHGRRLAADLTALRTQPPFAASAMDGYAVRADDLAPGAVLRVVGESAAGHRFGGAVGVGDAVRIFTGAPLPAGADTVLMQENAERAGDRVTVRQTEPRGRSVRAAGLDFAEGDRLLPAGRRLDARALMLAAAGGHGALEVRRRPRVALIATGDELVQPGAAVGPDQIVASNGYGLAAMVRAAGGEAVDLGIAPDRPDEIRARVRAALDGGADVVALLGGASVGDHDHARGVLEAEGAALDFWKIAMRPGKPLMAGRIGDGYALGLPGNPVSGIACAVLFLLPLVRGLTGDPAPLPRPRPARLGRDLPANDQRQDYLRTALALAHDDLPVATPFPLQDSSVITLAAAADALLIRPPFAPAAAVGDLVSVIPFED